MRMEDMILVSVDDHLVEPPHMFTERTPAKYKEQFPKFTIREDQTSAWVFEDQEISNIALNAVAGRRKEEYGAEPTRMEDLRKGTYDVHARIDDMNANGQLAGLNFASFVGTTGGLFLNAKDKDLALAALQAYNDWHKEEWCDAYPGRFVPLGIVPLWDAKLAAEEIKRLKAKGFNAISFPPNPSKLGLPSLHRDYWDPVWAVCNDLDVSLNMHIGDVGSAITSPDCPVDVFISNMPVTLYATASDLVYSPILRKYDKIKFALSEGGSGWIPHFLERIDYVYKHHSAWTHQDFGDKMPSQVFQEHVYNCFIVDDTAVKYRYDVGIDNITWEGDYPHSDSTWPESPEILWESIKGIPDADVEKICYQNACKLFEFDPFSHIKKADCTVGALRAQAAHVDLSFTETGGRGMPERAKSGVVTWESTMAQMPSAASIGQKSA